MPSTSNKQRKAMQAAASGHSTIGIPKSVGKEFAKADRKSSKSPFKLSKTKRRKEECD